MPCANTIILINAFCGLKKIVLQGPSLPSYPSLAEARYLDLSTKSSSSY